MAYTTAPAHAEGVRAECNAQIDEFTQAGVRVGACLNSANAAGTADAITARGITLQYARDAFVRYAQEAAADISF